MLGEDEDRLEDVALEMDPEDGRLTVYGVDDEGTTAFTDFGIENLKELIEIDKADPAIMERYRKPAPSRRGPAEVRGIHRRLHRFHRYP